MKSTVNKGILFYFLLLCTIVLGVACIIMTILIFSPGTELFGISYYGKKVDSYYAKASSEENAEYLDYLVNNNQLETFNISSDYLDINVMMIDINRIQLNINSLTTGIIKSGNQKNFVVNYNYDENTKTFNFNATGPKCSLFFSKKASINLYLPLDFNNQNLNLNLTSNDGDISIGNSKHDNFSFKNLNVEIKDSAFVNLGEKATFNNSLQLTVPKGEIKINSKLNTDLFKITSDTAKIEIDNINSSEAVIKTNSSIIKLGTVSSNLVYDSKKGVLDIEKITGTLQCEEDVLISNIFIDEAYDEIILPNAKSSTITINSLYARCFIRTETGDVTINQATDVVDIETESGDIDVVINTHSDISSPLNSTISNLVTKSGSINAKFTDVKFSNKIYTESGNISVSFKNGIDFILTYNCVKNKPTLSKGITTNEIQNSASFNIGTPNLYDNITILNNTGKTSIDDTFVF